MNLDAKQILRRLGGGEPIADVCAAAGLSRMEFDAFWREQCRQRLTPAAGEGALGLQGTARIVRDRRGVPHILADNDRDLFFAFGFAVAQDRLFQLDFLRRKAQGKLAEILGPSSLEQDFFYRALGLGAIAEKEAGSFDAETQALASAYCAGVNAWIEAAGDNLPIEFDLLDYRPAPWTLADSLSIVGEFRWYLTGRFPVIAIPELVKRAVGEGPLYQDFISGERDGESILFPGEYPTSPRWPGERGAGGGGGEMGGSNNWTLAGSRTATGKPLVASDPHVVYYAVSIWHEVHLRGGSFNVAGVALAGMPALMIGRNERVAWGITNNICSVRDLYQEKTDPKHPDCFLYDGRWEPCRQRQEEILVRQGEGEGDGSMERVRRTVRSSRHGPIVDELLPPEARHTGPVSLRWLGTEPCGWLPALLAMNRAATCHAFREAGRPWSVPTFNLVFADVDGGIGFQTVGRIPLRKKAERGYRAGWDPDQEWQGFIPYDGLPNLLNPKRGYFATANNRVAPDDFAYPLSGCWSMGYRHGRIRECLEMKTAWTAEDCRDLQMDTFSGRARQCVPALLEELRNDPDRRIRQAVERLASWDFHVNVDSVPAALFNVFFQHWCFAVTRERLPAEQVSLVVALAGGMAVHVLLDDPNRWLTKTLRRAAIRAAFVAMLDDLTARLGPDMEFWTWGRLHTLKQPHFLSGRGDLGALLDRSGLPVCGDGVSVCAGATDGQFQSTLGAGYRMVADLNDPRCGLWAAEVAGASGQPYSPHGDDQVETWNAGRLFYLPLWGEIEGDVWFLAKKP